MESIILPARSRHAIARREPNLLVPGRKPVGQVQENAGIGSPLALFVNEWSRGIGSVGGTAASGVTFERRNLNNPGTSNGVALNDVSKIAGAAELTVVVRQKWNALGLRNGIFGTRLGEQGFSVNTGYSTSSTLFVYCGSDANYTPQFTPTGVGSLVTGRYYNFVVRFRGSDGASDRVAIWIDGYKQSFSWNIAPGATLPAESAFYFSRGNNPSNCEQELAAVYGSAFSDAICEQISRDCFGSLLRPANQSPFLISIPGGGGATIEADLTISAFSGMTPGKNTIFESGLTVSNILSTDPILSNSVLDTAIVLSSTLLSEYSYTVSLEAAISFINSLSTIQNSIAIYETNGVYDIVHGTEYQSQVDFLVQVLFAKTVASLFTTGSIVETDILLGISQNILNSVTAVIEAATVYSTSQGMNHGNNALLNAVQSLDISQGIDFSSIASLQPSITFGIDGGIGIDGAVGTSQIDASLSMGLIQSYLTSTGSNTWEPNISVGLLQSIDAMTIANLFATTTLGSQLVFTTNGGNSIESAINYAIHHSNVYEVGISIEGNVNLGINQFLENSAQADISGAVLLTHQVGLQTVVQAVMNAGLTLSSISNITVNGSVLSLEVTLPCGRTLLVSIENRTLQIQADNRTISINGCN